MDITMQIASLSMNMSASNTQQAVDISLMKKVMNAQESQAAALLEGLPQQPMSFGHRLDVRV